MTKAFSEFSMGSNWDCIECKADNYGFRIVCRICGAGRFHPDRETNAEVVQEIREGEAADVAAGLMQPSDHGAIGAADTAVVGRRPTTGGGK